MSKRRRKGFSDFNAGLRVAQAAGREAANLPKDTPITARCDKCGQGMRAGPVMLATVRMGVADHGRCGGTFRLLARPATPSLLEAVEKIAPLRVTEKGELRPTREQAKLMAQHSYVLGYAELFGAQRGVVLPAHGDELAHGIQAGVMEDCPTLMLSEWYDDDLRRLAIDSMALVMRESPIDFSHGSAGSGTHATEREAT